MICSPNNIKMGLGGLALYNTAYGNFLVKPDLGKVVSLPFIIMLWSSFSVTRLVAAPMKSHPKVPHKCCVCKSKTTWYCVGCKRWFCMERRDTKENKKKLELYSHHVKGASMTFQKACFHRIHEERWRTETHPAVTP